MLHCHWVHTRPLSAGVAEHIRMAGVAEHFGTARITEQQTTVAVVAKTLRISELQITLVVYAKTRLYHVPQDYSAMLSTVNHTPPAQHATTQIQAFEDTPKLASIPMAKFAKYNP